MKLLFKGDTRAIKIIRKISLQPDAVYKLSRFVFPFETEGRFLLSSTLTKQVYELDAEEWEDLQSGTFAGKYRDELARVGFLIEKDYDELSKYHMVLKTLQAMSKKPNGLTNYTVLPTTACNARCPYCYEEGITPVSMTRETADAVIDFICRTKKDGKIHVDWFGGEPLLGAATISYICRGLKDRGVEFNSGMTTNVTLLTPEMMREAKELWNLERTQVSMDGAKPDYESRKCYVNPEKHNYEAAMKAVELLADAGITVYIRCNYDEGNLPRLPEFFHDCKERFGDRENVSLYPSELFQSSEKKRESNLCIDVSEMEKALGKMAVADRANLPSQLRWRYCMADCSGNSVIIDPQGGLHNCEHFLDHADSLGSIFDEKLPCWEWTGEEADICKSCCFLPVCTPFRRIGCPVKPEDCREEKELFQKRALRNLLKNIETEAASAHGEEDAEKDDIDEDFAEENPC
ncbi:MAG: radical SAM protein [Clostridia bacterium]|nr:radical SAM protein [Clostridia bacterium]